MTKRPLSTNALRVVVWPQTPLGPLWAELDSGDAVRGLHWGEAPVGSVVVCGTAIEKTIAAYFEKPGDLKDVVVAMDGTAYQQKIWHAVRDIPPGTVMSYGDLARLHGTGPRAIARAMASNRVPLIIPCHRVVGAGGGMGGYSGAGGVETKRWLLQHEGAL